MTGTERPRVLVAGDDYYASLAVVRGLHRGGYEPWFATGSPLTFASRSRATAGTFALPRAQHGDEAYATALADAAERCGAVAVLPCNEVAIKALAGRQDLFPAGVAVGTNPPETVADATDKAVLARLAGEAGVATPPSLELGPDDEARPAIPLPAVLKPASTAVGAGGKTWLAPPVELVEDEAALERALARAFAQTPRWLVQPYVDGPLISVAGVASHGRVLCTVHAQSERIYPVAVGNIAFAKTVPADAELDERLGEIVRRLGWTGIFQFQLIRGRDESFVIDLNPRPYGSLELAVGAGMNLPAIWADVLLGREPRIAPYRVGVRYRAEVCEVRALGHALAGGRVADALAILRPRRRTVHSIFSLRDPAPFGAVLARGTGKLGKLYRAA